MSALGAAFVVAALDAAFLVAALGRGLYDHFPAEGPGRRSTGDSCGVKALLTGSGDQPAPVHGQARAAMIPASDRSERRLYGHR